MRRPTDDDPLPSVDLSSDWGVAVAIGLTILICLAAFVWIFVGLDPFISDFTGTDAVVTPAPTDPATTPVDSTPDTDSVAEP
ncbi:MAG: hypothetical protein WEC79_01900 [Thermomicrobiales bacterium]